VARTGVQATEILADMGKLDPELHTAMVRYLRALALEVGAAVASGRAPAGVRLSDGRHSVDVRREPVIVYYTVHPEQREIRLTDLIWLRT
jgi:hypothetical protein